MYLLTHSVCFFLFPARVAGSSGEEHFDPKIPPEKQIVTYQTKDGQLKTVTKAELQEQMETREKLMNELNETWEQKLERTQEVQKEREKALEELGITVEKNLVGVHTPKRVRFAIPLLLHAVVFLTGAGDRSLYHPHRCHILSIWCVLYPSFLEGSFN